MQGEPELYTVASRILKGSMESVPGVAMGEVVGGSELQMEIILDREKLYSYHVGISELGRLIKESSVERVIPARRIFRIIGSCRKKYPVWCV